MIILDDVFKIGKLGKPHGLKGEIVFNFDNDIFSKSDCPYLICEVDKILVPFFIEEYRLIDKNIALIKFENFDSYIKVKHICGLNVYFPREYITDDLESDIDYNLDFFIGFIVIDSLYGELGEIVAVDDSTINTLFMIQNNKGEEILIPASEDFIVDLRVDEKILYTTLPKGLLE